MLLFFLVGQKLDWCDLGQTKVLYISGKREYVPILLCYYLVYHFLFYSFMCLFVHCVMRSERAA
jgi:hypothetical protein